MVAGYARAPKTGQDLSALLWLTPQDPFPKNSFDRTEVTYFFANPGNYTVLDPESSVGTIRAVAWKSYEKRAWIKAFDAWARATRLRLHPAKNFNSATLKLIVTDEAGMDHYFPKSAGVDAMSTLPDDYAKNYGKRDRGYTPGISVFNRDGDGWSREGLHPGGSGYDTLLHEIGHLLGLDHPWNEGGWYVTRSGAPLRMDGQRLREPHFRGDPSAASFGRHFLDQGVYTVMSYNSGWLMQPPVTSAYGYELTPGPLDIAAVRRSYGTSSRTSRPIFTLPAHNRAGTGWRCIWNKNASGIIAPVHSGPATIDLRSAPLKGPHAGGYLSFVEGVEGGVTIAHGTHVTEAVGGPSDDVLIGNRQNDLLIGGGGDDLLIGGSGRDVMIGGSGGDTLISGRGPDIFRYVDPMDSRPADEDLIDGFEPGKDRIDLRDLGSHHQLSWIGGRVFDGHAGQVRFSGDHLSVDLTGRGRADFTIKVPDANLEPKDILGLSSSQAS